MGKLTIQDLALVLAEKSSLSKKDARQFVASFYDVVQLGLERDRLVKIKGLGTFKVIDVDARESVNVNTGERVLIDGHAKITFTPDAAMKELVNKPFSGFETVVLNEGVTFDDVTDVEEPEINDMTVDEEPVIIEEPVEEQSVIEEPVVEEPVVEEPVVEEPVEEEPVVGEPVVEEPVVEEPVEEELVFIEDASMDDEKALASEEENEDYSQEEQLTPMDSVMLTEPDQKEKSRVWIWVLALIAVGIAAYFLGFYHGRNSIANKTPAVVEEHKEDSVAANDSVDKNEDTVRVVRKDTVKITPKESVETASANPPAKQADYKKYEAMDSRVRTGAYVIIGLDHVEKVRVGDTIERIARRTLGADMACYIEVYNGITAATPLKEGQEIKIPKLMTKKKLKKLENKEV